MSMFIDLSEPLKIPYRELVTKNGRQTEGDLVAVYIAEPLTGTEKRDATAMMASADVPQEIRNKKAWDVFRRKVTGVCGPDGVTPLEGAPEFERNVEGLRPSVMDRMVPDVIYIVGARIVSGNTVTEEDLGN